MKTKTKTRWKCDPETRGVKGRESKPRRVFAVFSTETSKTSEPGDRSWRSIFVSEVRFIKCSVGLKYL